MIHSGVVAKGIIPKTPLIYNKKPKELYYKILKNALAARELKVIFWKDLEVTNSPHSTAVVLNLSPKPSDFAFSASITSIIASPCPPTTPLEYNRHRFLTHSHLPLGLLFDLTSIPGVDYPESREHHFVSTKDG